MPFELPPLPYAYDALEPSIDAETMRLHHDKHHQTYVTNLNAALAKHPELGSRSLEDLVGNLSAVPEDIRTAVRNNGGQHLNHSIFWQIMGPDRGGEPTGDLAAAIGAAFGDVAAFKDAFSKAAIGQFGSGWSWLYVTGGSLAVKGFANGDNPKMEGGSPLLGIDVWEHAYYLRYQNKRADYVSAWWNVVNWDAVAERFASVRD
jgi:superoxide dismutase, Fe-Mn family